MAEQDFIDRILETIGSSPSTATEPDVNANQSRNAAKYLVALLTHRLSAGGEPPSVIERTTFGWGGGTINFRNFVDLHDFFWTNIRLVHAERIHLEHVGADFVFAMCHWNPEEDFVHLWLVPEGVLYSALPRLPEKASPDKKDIKIRRGDDQIFQDPQAVDLSGWHREIRFSEDENRNLREAYAADLASRARGKDDNGEDNSDDGDDLGVLIEGFPELMERYQQRGTTFRSPEMGAWYAIKAVNDMGCEVERLSAKESVHLTAKYFATHVGRLRATNGRCPIADFANNRAIAMAMLQAPGLGISVDRKVAMWFDTDQEATDHLCRLVEQFKVSDDNGRPRLYKPAILAAAIEGIEDGTFAENRFTLDQLLPAFQERHRKLGRGEVGRDQAAMGFFFLTSELFWLLSYGDSPHRVNEEVDAIRRQPRDGETPVVASLHETYWRTLQDPAAREKVLNVLAAKWWPDAQPSPRKPSYWWVNQGQAYEAQRELGILWAPQRATDNFPRHYYENVSKVRAGDIVFHYKKPQIYAVSIVRSNGEERPQPPPN